MLLLWMTHQCLKTLLHNIVQKQLSFSAVSSIPLYLFLNKIIMYFCTLTCIGQINLMCNNIRLWPVFICEIEPHVSREVLTRKQMIVIYLTPWQAFPQQAFACSQFDLVFIFILGFSSNPQNETYVGKS